jgi:hypothetical protein
MARPAIIEKLHQELAAGVVSERQVVYILLFLADFKPRVMTAAAAAQKEIQGDQLTSI